MIYLILIWIIPAILGCIVIKALTDENIIDEDEFGQIESIYMLIVIFWPFTLPAILISTTLYYIGKVILYPPYTLIRYIIRRCKNTRRK